MKLIRKHVLVTALVFVTGLVFLNISFVLEEVNMLSFEKRELLENILKLKFNTGYEGEKEGWSSSEDSFKESLPMRQTHTPALSSYLISNRENISLTDRYLPVNYSRVFSPPPELQKFF